MRQAILAIALIVCLLVSPIAILVTSYFLGLAGVDVRVDARWFLFVGAALGIPLLYLGQRKFRPVSRGVEHNRWLAFRLGGRAMMVVAAVGVVFLLFVPGD
jgi:hypothetical protein